MVPYAAPCALGAEGDLLDVSRLPYRTEPERRLPSTVSRQLLYRKALPRFPPFDNLAQALPAAVLLSTACHSYREPDAPAPCTDNSKPLETRPKAGICPQRRAFTLTGPAGRPRVTVG